ncbi:MAG: hypothetical protein QG622_1839 [Actinomycetota bacterium]|nr:hypothetical protein [Actinomycetota bacterium]
MDDVAPPDGGLGAALAGLWVENRPAIEQQLLRIEAAAGAALRDALTPSQQQEGRVAAHQLAGSLGSFGFHEGTRVARQLEALLRQAVPEARALSEGAVALRELVLEQPPIEVSALVKDEDEEPEHRLLIVSDDLAYADDLEREARLLGHQVYSLPHPLPKVLERGTTAAIVDLGRGGGAFLDRAERDGIGVPFFAITDATDFGTRSRLLRLRTLGVFRRTDHTRHILQFAVAALEDAEPAEHVTVLAVAQDAVMCGAIAQALSDERTEVSIATDLESCWNALHEVRPSVVVTHWTTTGPKVAHLLRTDPRWSSLPLIGVAESESVPSLESAAEAGAITVQARDGGVPGLRAGVSAVLTQASRLTRLSEFDPSTGCDRWEDAERSIDRLLRIGERTALNVVIAQVEVRSDPSDGVGANSLQDLLVHQVVHHIRRALRREDVITRNGDGRLTLALYNCPADIAVKRLLGVLHAVEISRERTFRPLHVRAGVAVRPRDGADLPALLRASERALSATTPGRPVLDAETFEESQAPQGDKGTVDVVIVEDDPAVASLINHALGLRQLTSLWIADGSEAALRLCSGEVNPRLVLLDIGLPGLDGFGVMSRLKQARVLDTVPVIVLTARYQEAETLRAFELGATDHMTKPFSIPVLLNRIERVLGQRT